MVALLEPGTTGREREDWRDVRLAAVSRRRWRWGIAAAALTAVGAAVGMGVGIAADETAQVAAVARDVPAGHTLTAADLHVVEMSGTEGLGMLLSVEQAEGAVTALPLAHGTFVGHSAVADSSRWPGPGTALVAVPAGAGTLPAPAGAGARVELVFTGSHAGDDPGGAGAPPRVFGRVHEVHGAKEPHGTEPVVELLVRQEHAGAVARAAADGAVRLALVSQTAEAGGAGEGDAGDGGSTS